MQITIETTVDAPIEAVWTAWTTPEDIVQWNAASDDWHCPSAQNDLRPGGAFSWRMEARDGSMGFDFEGTYTEVEESTRIAYTLGDDRVVTIDFLPSPNGVTVRETFTAEDEHTAEQQRQGWLAILERFRRHVEAKG